MKNFIKNLFLKNKKFKINRIIQYNLCNFINLIWIIYIVYDYHNGHPSFFFIPVAFAAQMYPLSMGLNTK